MAFQQLYYTSCEHGVGGYAGFQFNALSPGAGQRAMREVERLTVYELPSWDSSPADAPVNLCHVHDAARGWAITSNVIYAGTDFSGRAGNYFAHALVSDAPAQDFGGLLPVELWESPVWARAEAADTTLPAISDALPRGSFDRPTVAAFLSRRPDAPTVLARLLSAIDAVMRDGRSLILWSETSTENAYWIAAVSYLMQPDQAREMSFYTYTRRPAQCRAHVIGTVPGTVASAAVLADIFRVFDLTSRALPDVDVHPLAELLVQVGVLRTAGLWRQAATLADGTERTFDGWYPVALAAAGLLGIEPLPNGAADAMAAWLPKLRLRSAPLAGPHVEAVLTVLLDRHEELSDDQLRPLLDAAKGARAVGQLQRIEVILVNRALAQLEQELQPPEPVRLESAEGTRLAVAGCERLLGPADAAAVLTVLGWAGGPASPSMRGWSRAAAGWSRKRCRGCKATGASSSSAAAIRRSRWALAPTWRTRERTRRSGCCGGGRRTARRQRSERPSGAARNPAGRERPVRRGPADAGAARGDRAARVARARLHRRVPARPAVAARADHGG